MKTINSFRSKLLALTLALMASVSIQAHDFSVDGIYYNILDGNNVEVTFKGSHVNQYVNEYINSINIPNEVTINNTTYTVTRVGDGAFYACRTLNSVTIPNSVTYIGDTAFYSCDDLTTVDIGNAVTRIGDGAFFRCSFLSSITIPNSVTRIGNRAFKYCYSMTSVNIGSSVTEIGEEAFDGCTILNSVTIPNSVINIGAMAFQGCTYMTSVVIGNNVANIGNEAFRWCYSLTSIKCHNTTPPILGENIFEWGSLEMGPYQLDTLYVPAESLNLYKEAEQWNLFNSILPIKETSYKSQWCDTWNIFVENGSVYPPHEETYRYQLAQDTVIGDYIYTAVVSKATNDALDAPRYVAAVRFTDDRKVYIYYDNAEYLLYDFNVQEGDELEVFVGINNYTSEIKTYKCTVTGVEQYACVGCPATITLEVHNHPDDFREFYRQTQWIEGVGDINGFLNGLNGYINIPGNAEESLLCAYKGDELKYTGPLYEKYGCEYNANDPLPLYPWCNQWNILAHGYLGPREPLYGAKTTIYQLGGDTIINHLRYQQLTRYASDDVNQTKTYVGAIRFTKNNRQVYFYYDNAEYLLYDFKAQIGDTLEVFAGIDNYRDHKTYKHVVTNIEPIEDEQCKVTLDVFVSLELEGEIIHEEKFTTTWIEGVGSPDGIVHNCATLREGNVVTDVLCAYVDDRRMYRTPYPDYRILGCEYNDGDFIEDAFPMLSGLQRTVCNEYCGDTEDDNSANNTYKQTFDSIFFENDKPYILCNDYLLREEDNKILIYSQSLNKDLVLYDFTLEVGDSLSALYVNAPQLVPPQSDDITMVPPPYNGYIEYYNSYGTTESFFVTEVSSVTLLDGNVYKKWTFDNGMEYVEGIGMYGGRRNGNFFGLIQEVVVPCHIGTHLVCVSRNGQLLYQMDAAAMERLGAECLCDYNSGPKKDNAKNGKIGGRPTPTQWNMLEVETKEMDGTPTILRAETFSYTLENDSIVAKGKTFYQLARQSTKDTAITKSFVGALHFGEDEDNRVYFLRDGVEYVLYDFTAEPGDTIEIFAGINNYPQETTYTHVVVDKDTTEDGACRMFLEVVFPDETTIATNAEKVWLAGLGSIDGIVHNAAQRTSDAHAAPAKSASSETQTSVMLCAWREDSCLYTTNHPEYDTFGCVYNQDPTAVEDISTTSSYQKILHEGKLLILHNGKIYNVLGVSVK